MDMTSITVGAYPEDPSPCATRKTVDDVEFAFDIGTALLAEIRRLQSLHMARDRTIADLQEENAALARPLSAVRTRFAEPVPEPVDALDDSEWVEVMKHEAGQPALVESDGQGAVGEPAD